MKFVKSERLKKLEAELTDLEQWLKLGLVPKKDIEKHKEEISAVHHKIEEEKDRLNHLKESGEVEEYVTPKRQTGKTGYTEMPTIPDIDIGDSTGGGIDTGFDMKSETESDHLLTEEHDDDDEKEKEDGEDKDEDDDSFFNNKNRWRRGGIIDPDANDW